MGHFFLNSDFEDIMGWTLAAVVYRFFLDLGFRGRIKQLIKEIN